MEMIHIRLPKEQHKKLKLYAVSDGKSMTELVGDLIARFLRDNKEVA